MVRLARLHLHARTAINRLTDEHLLEAIALVGSLPGPHIELLRRVPDLSTELAQAFVNQVDKHEKIKKATSDKRKRGERVKL